MSRARSLANLANSSVFSADSTHSRIGINSTAPAKTLDVVGDGRVSGTLSIGGTINYEDVTSIDSIGVVTARDGVHIVSAGASIYSPANNELALYTNSSEKVRVNSSGSVGIGTDTSGFATRLVVGTGDGETGNMTLFSGISSSSYIHFADGKSGADRYRGYVTYQHSDNSMLFGTNDVERLRITSGGVVKIGGDIEDEANDIDTTNTKLTIKQSAMNLEDGIYLERPSERRGHYIRVATSGNAQDALVFGTSQAGTETDHLLALDRSGNVTMTAGRLGIGTDNPLVPFVLSHGGNINIEMGYSSGGVFPSNYLQSYNRGTSAYAPLAIYGSEMAFFIDSTERMRIDTSGRLLVGGSSSTKNYKLVVRNNAGNDGFEGGIFLQRATTPPASVTGGHGLGTIVFGAAPTGDENEAAQIIAKSDGTWGVNDWPSRLEFYTTPDGSNTMTERMTIDSNGKIYIGPYRAPAAYGTSAHNIPYKIGVAPYGWQNGSDIAEISMGNHSGSTGNDDGEIMFRTASNVHSSATGLQNRMQITSTGDTLFYGDAVQYAPNAFYIQTHALTTSWTSYQTIATGLSSNTIYLVSINWQHGSSANQPYYYATSFLFHTANGTNGSTGENEKTFLHTTHTGGTGYFMTFRGIATAGGGSTGHKLQAKINSNWPGITSGNNLKLALTKVMNGTRSF